MEKLTLGYWGIRGRGQVLRLLLAYTGTEFQETRYLSQEKWFAEDKVNLGFDFPNLPYIIDGDFKLTESIAVAKYIINRSGKTDLLGKNIHDHGKVENLIGVLNDALKEIQALFWNKDYETIKIEVLEKARTKLDYVKNFIGHKDFALGYLTFVDFLLAENLHYFETLYPSQSHHFSFWWRIRSNFNKLPEIEAYYKRADAVKGPFLPPFAALQPVQKHVKLAYWGIRGLAQTPRLLLSYGGIEFEDFHYGDGEKWFKEDKLHLGLDFPNLPYLIDQDYNVTESGAIQRYIIQKSGKTQLLGKNIKDNAKIESFLSVFNEVSSAVKGLFFNKDHETAKVALIEKYASKLTELSKFVGERDFVLGYLTLADFVVAEDSNYIEKVYPEVGEKWSFLRRIRENFNKVPEIVAYYEKPTAFKGRFYPESAFISIE